jgi:hypothetical protein
MTLPNRPTAAQETQSAYAPAWELGCSSTRESHCRRTGTWDANTVGVVYSAATGNVDPSSSRRMQSAGKSAAASANIRAETTNGDKYTSRERTESYQPTFTPSASNISHSPSITALIKNRHGRVHLDKQHPRHLRGQCRPPQVCGPRVGGSGGLARRSAALAIVETKAESGNK